MTSTKTTRRALLSSLLSLLLCCSMLLGTTFAWFTDSVTSTGNIIKSGTLDVEMSWSDTENGTYKDASEGAIFDYKFWEPGFTQTKYIKVENKGDLAFQYQLRVIPNDLAAEGTKLAEVIDVYCAIVEDGTTKNFGFAAPGRNDWGSLVKLGTLKELMAKETGVDDGVLLPRLENGNSVGSDKVVGINGENYTGHVTVCMALHMQEEAGNEYQNLSIGNGFKVELLAAQMSYEMDSFDHLYDQNAQWPVAASGSGSFATTPISSNKFTVEVKDLNDASGNPNIKVAVATVDRASVEEDTTVVTINVSSTATNPNVTVANGMTARTYEIDAIGLKEGNTTPVKMELYVGEDLSDPVELYHYGTKINSTYNPNSGYIIFETAEFSPFTVVFANEETENEPAGPSDLPVANVTRSAEYENVDLAWGSYGQWSPTAGLDSQLEAAYTFQCVDVEGAASSPYANWYCDFYVKLDKDLGENEIFLGGNYGSFGWVGFHNGDLTLDANTEIALLGSVTSNPWTYEMVAENVGTFICGVGDVDNALAGATFTVMLRLTNPEDEDEYYNVSTINYTFTNTKQVSDGAELETALTAGGEIALTGVIDLADDPIVIAAGTQAVIDLNGHTLSGLATSSTTSNLIKVPTGAELTLKNGTVSFAATTPDTNWGGEGQPAYPGYANNTISNSGKLIIDGATIENLTEAGGASYAIDCYPGSDLVINNGTIKGYDKVAIRMFANSATNNTKVTINGGEISGRRGIWIQLPNSDASKAMKAELNINGGAVTALGEDDCAIYSYSYGNSFAETDVTITGGTFNGDVCFGGGENKATVENVTITGGIFNGELGRYLVNDGWEDIAKP